MSKPDQSAFMPLILSGGLYSLHSKQNVQGASERVYDASGRTLRGFQVPYTYSEAP